MITENSDSQEPGDWAHLVEFIVVHELVLDSGSLLIYRSVIDKDNIINIEEDKNIIG